MFELIHFKQIQCVIIDKNEISSRFNKRGIFIKKYLPRYLQYKQKSLGVVCNSTEIPVYLHGHS